MCFCFREKEFSIVSRRLGERLVLCRHPTRTPLTASSLCPCIYFPFRPNPRWELTLRLHLDFRSRIQKHFPVNSISHSCMIDQWAFEASSSEFVHPASRYHKKTCLRRTRISIRSWSANRISRCVDLGFMLLTQLKLLRSSFGDVLLRIQLSLCHYFLNSNNNLLISFQIFYLRLKKQ